MFSSDHHQRWRRRWRAPWGVLAACPPSTTSTLVVATAGSYRQHPLGPAINVFNFGGGHCRTLPLAPPKGAAIDVFNSGGGRWRTLPPAPPKGTVIDVFSFGGGRYQTLPLASHRGPAIDVFNFSGGRCQTLPPAPPWSPPSTSSSLVAAAGGPCHQHHPGAPPPPSTSHSIDGGSSRIFSSNWPHLRVGSLSRGGPRASVGTLKTEYPCIQALSQDKEQGVHPHAATSVIASDYTSLLKRWAPAPPRVPRPQTSPPCRGELQCYHVSRDPGPRLLAEVSSDAATYSLAPDLASLLR
jgi:hypothetical protein